MVRRVLAVFAVAVIPFIVVPGAFASGASAASGAVSVADLVTQSVAGSASFTSGANGCGVGSLEFDGSYLEVRPSATSALPFPDALTTAAVLI
jgi:hypothetical protein